MLIDDVDIVELVSRYTPLTKDDRDRYWGRCPFCGAEDKAFSVSPTKGLWYCFNCKQGGNRPKFLSLVEKISYYEAMQRLGIKADDNPSPKTRAEILAEFNRLLEKTLELFPNMHQEERETVEKELAKSRSILDRLNAKQVAAPNQSNTSKQE